MWRFEYLGLGLLLFFACRSISYVELDDERWVEIPYDDIQIAAEAVDSELYAELAVQRVVRTQFHVIHTAGLSSNYVIEDAEVIVRDLLAAANERLRTNAPMSLYDGEPPAVYDSHIQIATVSPAIVHHELSEQSYFIKKGPKANRYDRKTLQKYTAGQDSVLHVFLMAFDPDELTSGRQKKETTGIAFGNIIKLAGLYESGQPGWAHAGLLNHEIGHALGLKHSWNRSDGCDDTPRHPNCWVPTADGPCSAPTSNNLMDYNAHQAAITPCQIATMHRSMLQRATVGSQIVEPMRCDEADEGEPLKIMTESALDGPLVLSRDIIIESDATLHIRGDIIRRADRHITVKKGATIIWHWGESIDHCNMLSPVIRAQKGGVLIKREKSQWSL